MCIFKHEKENGYFGGYIERVFCLDHNGKQSIDKVADIQDEFITTLISREYADKEFMKFLFGVIANFEDTRKKKFISQYLDKNKSYEDFEEMDLEPNQWSWSGSKVPLIAGRIDFLQSLLPLLDGAAFLRHRQYIEGMIAYHQKDLEREKKSDFVDD